MDEAAIIETKRSKAKIFLIILIVLLLIIGIASGVVIYKATKPLNEGRFNAQATADFKKGFMKAMMVGGETEFTNDDFNGMLAYSAEEKRQKAKEEGKSEKVTLTEIEFKPNGGSKLYARTFIGPFTFDVIADVDIRLDIENNVVEFKLTDAVMGDFHISPETIIEKYKSSLEDENEADKEDDDTDVEFMKFTSTSITFPATYSYELFGTVFDFGFEDIKVDDGKMTVNAKKPLGDWGDLIYSFLFNEE